MDTKTDSRLPSGTLLSVQAGKPQKMTTAAGRKWESAIAKTPLTGKVPVDREHVADDRQTNLKYHGGPNKAVCGYPVEHFAVWKQEFDLDMTGGAFGENLTVSGLTEDALCLGDILLIGSVRLQVSQPRIPCVNVSRRWNCTTLPERMMATGFTGYYFRVLQVGEVEAGDSVTVVERSLPEWTVLRMNQTLYHDSVVREQIVALSEVGLLTAEWKRALGRKLKGGQGAL